MGLTASDEEPQILSFLTRNPGCSYVAETDSRVVGTILAGHNGRHAMIYHLVVDPSLRGRGIATELLGRSLGALRQQGIDKGYLIVMTNNTNARGFWDHVGAISHPNLELRRLVLADYFEKFP